MPKGPLLFAVFIFLSSCSLPQIVSRSLAMQPSPLYANGKAFTVEMREGDIFLEGKDCADLRFPAEALAAWQKLGTEYSACHCREGSCEWEITGLLPGWLKDHLGKTDLKPNCFNTALIAAGLEKTFRFVKFFEFAQAIRARCTPTEDPVPGDIGVVSRKGEGLSPVHAFVYFTPDFGFEKPGANLQDPWRFMNPARIIGSPSPYSYGSSKLQYFRCR